MPRVSRQLGSFTATDRSGKVYTVYVRQEFTVAHGAKGTREAPAGQMMLNPDDGTPVSRTRKGVYEIAVGKVLTSDDPKAP